MLRINLKNYESRPFLVIITLKWMHNSWLYMFIFDCMNSLCVTHPKYWQIFHTDGRSKVALSVCENVLTLSWRRLSRTRDTWAAWHHCHWALMTTSFQSCVKVNTQLKMDYNITTKIYKYRHHIQFHFSNKQQPKLIVHCDY